jgi:hypothetical protein
MVSVTVVALLVVSTFLASYFLLQVERRDSLIAAAAEDASSRIAEVGDTIAAIGAAQQSYVAPGQLDEPWFERVTTLIDQLQKDLASLRPRLTSAQARTTLQMLVHDTEALVTADRLARQNLRLGEELMAADVIYSDGRHTLEGAIGRLREVREAEFDFSRAARSTLSRQRWVVLALAAMVWTVAIVALLTVPAAVVVTNRHDHPDPLEAPPAVEPAASALSPLDLTAAAELCSDLSRITTTGQLPALFARAADLLDASGIVLWMGTGEHLFAVTGHGYHPTVLARLGPIERGETSAAATAWRTGRSATVAAEGTKAGAVVAPLLAPGATIGVLAVEVRRGRERDPSTQAVARVIAAQLATIVAAWTPASAAEPSSDMGDRVPTEPREVRLA